MYCSLKQGTKAIKGISGKVSEMRNRSKIQKKRSQEIDRKQFLVWKDLSRKRIGGESENKSRTNFWDRLQEMK